jgi:hypothetical protein
MSPPLPLGGAVLDGLLVDAELGLLFPLPLLLGVQGTVLTFAAGCLGVEEADGRPGNALAEPEALDALDAVPQDRFCETEEREDAAVDDLSFNTRVDFGPFACLVVDEEDDEVVAHPRGIEPLGTLGPGSEG